MGSGKVQTVDEGLLQVLGRASKRSWQWSRTQQTNECSCGDCEGYRGYVLLCLLKYGLDVGSKPRPLFNTVTNQEKWTWKWRIVTLRLMLSVRSSVWCESTRWTVNSQLDSTPTTLRRLSASLCIVGLFSSSLSFCTWSAFTQRRVFTWFPILLDCTFWISSSDSCLPS